MRCLFNQLTLSTVEENSRRNSWKAISDVGRTRAPLRINESKAAGGGEPANQPRLC